MRTILTTVLILCALSDSIKKDVAHIDSFKLVNGELYLSGIHVQTDPRIDVSELLYVKEEVMYRVSGSKLSIVPGDNNEF